MEKKVGNYELVTDLAAKINMLKDYEAGYFNPRSGVMVVNYNGTIFAIEARVLPELTIEDAIKNNNYLFRDKI